MTVSYGYGGLVSPPSTHTTSYNRPSLSLSRRLDTCVCVTGRLLCPTWGTRPLWPDGRTGDCTCIHPLSLLPPSPGPTCSFISMKTERVSSPSARKLYCVDLRFRLSSPLGMVPLHSPDGSRRERDDNKTIDLSRSLSL